MLGNIKRFLAFSCIAFILSITIYFNYLNIKTVYVGLSLSEMEGQYRVTDLVQSGAAYFAGIKLGDVVVSVDGSTAISKSIMNNGRLEQVKQLEIERESGRKVVEFQHSNELMGQLFSFVLMPIIFFMLTLVSLLLVGIKTFTHWRFFFPVLFLSVLSLSMVSGMLSSKQFILAQYVISISMLCLPYLYFKIVYIKIKTTTKQNYFSRYNVLFGMLTVFVVGINVYYERNDYIQLLFGTSFLLLFVTLIIGMIHGFVLKTTRSYLLILMISFVVAVGPFAFLTLLPELIFSEAFLEAEVAILAVVVIPLIIVYLLATDTFFIKQFSFYKSFYFFLLSIVPSLLSVGIFLVFVNAREYEFMLVHLLYVYILLSLLTFFAKDILDRKLRFRIPSVRAYYHESLTKFSELLKHEKEKDHIMEVLRKEATAVLGLKNVEIKTHKKVQKNVFDTVSGRVSWCIVEDGENKYVLHGYLKRLKWLNSHQRDWLFIISSYISMKFENLQQMDELIEELKILEDNQEENQWISTLFFKWAERERLHLALDIHDTVLQELILHARQIETYKNQLNAIGYNTVQSKIQQIEENARDLILMTRETMEVIQPVNSKTKTIDQRLQEFIDTKIIRSDFEIVFSYSVENDLSSELQTNTFRISQELINNGIKHSNGSKITLQIEQEADYLVIEYSDNGIGIQKKSPKENSQHLGMFGIRKRVHSSQGKLSIYRSQSGGVGIQIYLSL